MSDYINSPFYDANNDVERILAQENSEKKKIGRNIFYRAKRTGGVRGGVITPCDLLKGNEKREYKKGGEVKLDKLYTKFEKVSEVPSLKDIDNMSFEEAQRVLTLCKETFSVKELVKHWKTNGYHFYKELIPKYKLEHLVRSNTGGRGHKKDNAIDRTNRKNSINMQPERPYSLEVEEYPSFTSNIKFPNHNTIFTGSEPQGVPQATLYQLQQIYLNNQNSNDGFRISLKGEYLQDKIESKVLGLVGALEEGRKYKINFEIIEIDEEEKKEEQS